MKSFEQFLKEEISIKGNKGVPSDKISDIERRGAEKIRGANPQQLMSQIMGFLRQSQSFTKGKEKELEKLAKEVIEDAFGLVLANVDLDINMVKDGNKIAEFMEKEEEEKEEEEEEEESQEEEEEEETPEIDLEAQPSREEIKLAVDKRKIMNNIIQGEAKNTKHILHSDKCKQGLERIYGAKWREIFDIWDNMSKIADKLDWIIPIQHKADMMENAPGGMAGCVSCRFPKKKKKEKSKSDEELANDVLKSLEDGEDMMDKQEDIKKLLGVTKPTIKARGIDFPMLLHETVKGIYEMIADVAMPKGKKLATEVHRQTSSFADEAEDFRYGPYLAQDLTDFIAKNSKVDEYPNVKEYVFGKLIDSDRWSDEECLLNLKNVFLESPEGRQLIDSLIDETIEELDEYNNQMAEWEAKNKDYGDKKNEPSIEEVPEWWKEEGGKSEESEEVDYSKMSQREIQLLIDDALDSEDYVTVGKLSQYLKEGKEIYLKEIERINESHKFHTRIK
jgi:hypothetical protein